MDSALRFQLVVLEIPLPWTSIGSEWSCPWAVLLETDYTLLFHLFPTLVEKYKINFLFQTFQQLYNCLHQ